MNVAASQHDTDLAQANRVDLACDVFDGSWRSGQIPEIGSFLESSPAEDRPELLRELLLIDIEYRQARGEVPDTERLCQQYPDYKSVVAQVVEELPATISDRGESGDTADLADGQHLGPGTVLGDYELLDQLGIGGMGIVYRARQRSAERIVALKIIHPDHLRSLSSEHRETVIERFQTEAQAAARLENEGIVTVYDVGQCDGRHFFSMRYVEGLSLSEILRDGPLENRVAARYLRAVAIAVHAAHEQGILHRDLKPQNILIDGRMDLPLVADFGLAKIAEHQSELTRTGEMMGTPQYMAPEQARDAATTTNASDVYSLGATLYHMLTGRPPFQAARLVDTIKQLIDEDPVRPRQLNRSIDPDLETICLHCLAKEPGRRLASAELLADELGRYLDGLPIRLRRIGMVSRAWRWCRRNPLAAALSAGIVLALTFAAVTSTVGYLNASFAQRQSEAGFRDSRRTLDRFVARIREEDHLNTPELLPLKEDLIREALDYYRDFLAQRANDPAVQDEVAETYFRIGQLTEEIVSLDESLEAYRAACKIQQQLIAQRPGDMQVRMQLSNSITAVGRVQMKLNQPSKARGSFARALDIRRRLVSVSRKMPDISHKECQRLLINSHMNIGIVLRREGKHALALQEFHQAQYARDTLAEFYPNDLDLQRDFAKGAYNIGIALAQQDDLDESSRYLQQALDQFVSFSESSTEEDHYFAALCFRALGELEESHAEALAHYQQAVARIERLNTKHPDVEMYAEEYGELLFSLAQLVADTAHFESSLEYLDRSESIFTTLQNANPKSTRFADRLNEIEQMRSEVKTLGAC